MKKTLSIVFATFILYFLTGCGNNSNQQNLNSSSNNYIASRTSTENQISENINNNLGNTQKTNVEENLATFSTKIYTPNDEARQNNIRITCSELNGTIVKSRRNIFFLQYSRKSNSRKGI